MPRKSVSIWKEEKSLIELFEKAYAKLNLTLDVLGLREDGYHALQMVMHSVSLCDDVMLKITDEGSWRVSGSDAAMPLDEKNLAWKAVKAYFDGTDLNPGVEIFIEKRIPSGAGMAGGSSDAAAVLRGLNRHFGLHSQEELARRALLVGSDVPYCLVGSCMVAEGRGEILTEIFKMPECYVVIAKPELNISTPELFHAIDSEPIDRRPNLDAMCAALAFGDLHETAKELCNVFEPVAVKRHPERVQILHVLRKHALGAAMTGTGSACFGLFDDLDRANEAVQALHQLNVSVFLEKPV